MTKKKTRVPKTGPIMHIDSVAATMIHKPLYNGWVCKGGIHGDTKYNRRSNKAETRRIIEEG